MRNKLIIFTAEWCRPCKRLKKTINELDIHEKQSISIADYDIHKDLVSWMNIEVIPTIIVLNHKDQEVKRVVGVQSKEKILELLNE